ncbi:MAG: endonuclease III [Methanoregula sp.]|jgi:endonuclease-3
MDMKKTDAARIYSLLVSQYPHARESPTTVCRGTPFEVLILTILSAQTTDKAVLMVRKPLFDTYPTPEALAQAEIKDVEPIIHRLGFYHAKAKNIIAAAATVIEKYGGIVPDTMDKLLTIPGVGRKTANIVLYHGYGINRGIAVDTHVRRLAQRIGFSDTDDVAAIEKNLMTLFPEKEWGDLTDVFIAHGRATCDARKPLCESCVIQKHCRYFHNLKKPAGKNTTTA